MAVAVGHATTVTWESGFFIHLTTVEWSGLSRGAVETTDMATSGAQTFIPEANFSPGTLEVSGNLDREAIATIPINSAASTCTVAFAGSGNTYAASAFMTDFNLSSADKSEMTYSGTLQFSGTITGL